MQVIAERSGDHALAWRECRNYLVAVAYAFLFAATVSAQGSWDPPGADPSYPRILLDSVSVPVIRETLSDPEILALYRSIWLSAGNPVPAGDSTDGDRFSRSLIAREAAFAVLMDRKYDNGNIVPMTPSERDSLAGKSRWLLENLNPSVGYQQGWVFYQEWQMRSKELINYLVAWDLLRGAGYTDESLQKAKDSVTRFTANLYHRAMDVYQVLIFHLRFFTFQFNNHSIMTASALGLAAILFNDSGDPDPEKQPLNWINAGLWNLDNTLWVENGIYPRVSEPDTIAGYAEGPGYFSYAFQNAFPFIRAMGNFLPDGEYPVTFGGVIRQVRNPWIDPRYDRIYEWMNRIRMPNGSLPAIHDSPVGFGTTITALSGKSEFNIPNPLVTPDDPFIRTQYIAGNVPHGNFTDSLFQPLPAAGSLVFRSSWDTTAIYMHLIGKHGIALSGAKSHHQGDAGSFSLFAHGQLLALDPGYPGATQSEYVNKPENHSLILVNGNGPNPPIGEFVNTTTNTAYIQNYFTTPFLDYGEVATSYYGAQMTRKVLFVRKKYFFITDFISSTQANTYTFQLHGNGLEGASPTDPEGQFVPLFGGHSATWKRDSVTLHAKMLISGGNDSLYTKTDSMATGYGTYRRYTKLMVSNAEPMDSAFFVTTLFPEKNETPSINGSIGLKHVWTWVTGFDYADVIFCQQEQNWIEIPVSYSGLPEITAGNGKVNIFSLGPGNEIETAFIENGDSLTYGNQTFISCSKAMNVAFEKINDTRYAGYVSDTGIVALFSNIPLRVVQGGISQITYDQPKKLNYLSFSSPGNFILEPSNGIGEPVPVPDVAVMPNPSADGHFIVEIRAGSSGRVRLSVSDLSGKKLVRFSHPVSSGKTIVQVDLSDFPPGIFLLEVSSERGSRVMKMVRL
ncbi:MAG: heparinase II/III family protein [bacterium]